MKVIAPLLTVLLLLPVANVTAQGTDPLSVAKRYSAAQDAGEVETALAFFADDAVITNTRGSKVMTTRGFIESNVKAGMHEGELINPQVAADTVTWSVMERTNFFLKLGITLIEVRAQAVVQDGKIKSLDKYYPPESLERLRRACESPQGQDISLFGQSCTEFLKQAEARTKSVFANLKP